MLALLLLSWLALGTASAAERRFDEIRAHVVEQMQARSISSLAVAVVENGSIVWEEGFGWADREKRVPATPFTLYSTASISKPMTATGLMVLVREGKVDLDRPINDYLGTVKLNARIGDAAAATVRRIATHTGGLPTHANFFFADEPVVRPSVEDTIRRYGNLVYPPGERFAYSNLGYGLLDEVIARASDATYAEFMRREVFLPLGMTRTSVDVPVDLAPYAAIRYGDDGAAVPFYGTDHPGASAIYSSAHDLALFGMFHLKRGVSTQQRVIDDAAIEEMHRPVAKLSRTSDGGETPAYSLGFFVDDKNGYRVVSHSGGMIGVATEMLLVPERGIAIIVLSNSANALAFETSQKIAATLLPHWKATPLRSDAPPPAFVSPACLIGTWKGAISTYRGEVPVELDVRRGGDVHVRLADQLPTLLSGARFEDHELQGTFASFLDTPDTARYEHVIDLSLNLRGETLNGSAKAAAARNGRVAPRVRTALSHWIELKRMAPAQGCGDPGPDRS